MIGCDKQESKQPNSIEDEVWLKPLANVNKAGWNIDGGHVYDVPFRDGYGSREMESDRFEYSFM